MCAMRKQSIIDIRDLRFVCITCPHCNTRVVLDMDAEFTATNDRPKFAPIGCPGCRKLYDSVVENLNALHRAYVAIRDAALGTLVTFVSENPPLETSN